jgi:hypothetical protein
MAKMETTPELAKTPNVDLTSLLERLDSQDALIAKLTAQANPENKFAKSKEKYQ